MRAQLKPPAAVVKQASTHRIAFNSLVDSGIDWLTWIEGAVRVEQTFKHRVPWEQLDGEEKKFIQSRLKIAQPENRVLLNSLYVTMVAGFEEFLRSCIRGVARQISDRGLSYDTLDRSILRMNIRESAKLLKRMDSPPDYLPFSENELCRTIGSCVPGSEKIELNQHAIADIDGLIKLENFFKRLATLGKSVNWDSLGQDEKIKAALGMNKGKAREVGSHLAEEMQNVARYRNRIAHTGGEASDVTMQVLAAHRDLLQALSSAIDSALA